MPLEIVLTLAGYLMFSFLLSAMLVRFAPKTEVARMSRKHFYFFPFVPIMIAALFLALALKWAFVIGVAYPFRLIRRTFEILSGHKRRRRKTYYRY
ncbi:hypothetical protein SAMN02745824_1296 [Parasphingorhabdus marina DSM 22363]|uniref:Uncharacterized protein n=1 Tax=Parasphingorhabdus marina DSM 22363 TaxID=1123272 RepID=A0A1N6CZB4_9SPHN|nr:hypothetical protein [Parasphingorhabdus marina]SIN63806.1 hypothetical protein SAMN02745824_1296 [Parasphingorhabdus marina DSM 22363]